MGCIPPILFDNHFAAVRVVADAHTTYMRDTVVCDAKIMKLRALKILDVNMNPASSLSRNLAIHIMDVAVVNVDVFKHTFRLLRQNIYTKQVALIGISPVGIGDLKAVNFPERWILQKKPRLMYALCVDERTFAFSIGLNDDGIIFCAAAFGTKHSNELGTPLEKNDITGVEGIVIQAVERALGINSVFGGTRTRNQEATENETVRYSSTCSHTVFSCGHNASLRGGELASRTLQAHVGVPFVFLLPVHAWQKGRAWSVFTHSSTALVARSRQPILPLSGGR